MKKTIIAIVCAALCASAQASEWKKFHTAKDGGTIWMDLESFRATKLNKGTPLYAVEARFIYASGKEEQVSFSVEQSDCRKNNGLVYTHDEQGNLESKSIWSGDGNRAIDFVGAVLCNKFAPNL
jgi:uncharacterized protein YxeA